VQQYALCRKSPTGSLDARSKGRHRSGVTTGLRVVFAPEHVTVASVKTVQPRSGLRLAGLGSPPSQLKEASPAPCVLQFFVSYQNLVRSEEPTAPKLFATVTGQLERSTGTFSFTGADNDDPIQHEPVPPPPPDADPRVSRPLEFALLFDTSQFDIGEQLLQVPRLEDDKARFVEIRAQVAVAGQLEVSLDTSDVWDVPYAPLERKVRFHVVASADKTANLQATDSAQATAFNDAGEVGDNARDFDLTTLPPDDEFELELKRGSLPLAPPLKVKLRELELGLLLEDAARAAQSITTADAALPEALSGSETHDFGDIPFDETPKTTFVAFTITSDDGTPLAGQAFTATFDDGTVRTGTLDAQGSATLTGVPSGDVAVVLAADPDAVLTISEDEVA